jgi:uncharacterized protein (TIGR03067 family)
MKTRIFFALVAALLVAAGDTKKDQENMQGAWTIVAIEDDGKELDKNQFKNRRVIIQGNRYSIKEGDKVIDQGSFKLDATRSPKTIDIMPTLGPNAGKTLRGIYQLEEDDRAVCFGPPGSERPANFATKPGSHLTLVIYKREKR